MAILEADASGERLCHARVSKCHYVAYIIPDRRMFVPDSCRGPCTLFSIYTLFHAAAPHGYYFWVEPIRTHLPRQPQPRWRVT